MRRDVRTDGQTDMTKLIVAFRNFSKAPNKETYCFLNHISNVYFKYYVIYGYIKEVHYIYVQGYSI